MSFHSVPNRVIPYIAILHSTTQHHKTPTHTKPSRPFTCSSLLGQRCVANVRRIRLALSRSEGSSSDDFFGGAIDGAVALQAPRPPDVLDDDDENGAS